MLLTIALSGMDSATETALRAAFAGANAQLDGRCALVPETESQHVIVDMDSMYGPMSWLRLHAAGKQVIGLTSAPRVQTHYRLARPFDEHALVALLQEMASDQGVSLSAPPVADATPDLAGTPEPPAAVARTPVAGHAVDVDRSRLEPAGTVHKPQDEPAAASGNAPTRDTSSDAVAGAQAVPDIGTAPPLPAAPTSITPPGPASAPAQQRSLLDWLDAGVLHGRRRFRRETGPTLLFDFDAQQYHGPTTLKPLTQYFEDSIGADGFEAIDDAGWQRETTAAGTAQPLARLRWLGALLAGDGSLAAGYDPDARYLLNKWPQTEREYPRHFRIATAMMKGPATLAEIATASSLPAEEIHRFVNANLVTGYAEPMVEVVEVAPDASKGSFLSRLRGR